MRKQPFENPELELLWRVNAQLDKETEAKFKKK